MLWTQCQWNEIGHFSHPSLKDNFISVRVSKICWNNIVLNFYNYVLYILFVAPWWCLIVILTFDFSLIWDSVHSWNYHPLQTILWQNFDILRASSYFWFIGLFFPLFHLNLYTNLLSCMKVSVSTVKMWLSLSLIQARLRFVGKFVMHVR